MIVAFTRLVAESFVGLIVAALPYDWEYSVILCTLLPETLLLTYELLVNGEIYFQ